jgi:hypothetical protein
MNSLFNPYLIDESLLDDDESDYIEYDGGDQCEEVTASELCDSSENVRPRGLGKVYVLVKTFASYNEALKALEEDQSIYENARWVKGKSLFYYLMCKRFFK